MDDKCNTINNIVMESYGWGTANTNKGKLADLWQMSNLIIVKTQFDSSWYAVLQIPEIRTTYDHIMVNDPVHGDVDWHMQTWEGELMLADDQHFIAFIKSKIYVPIK